MGKTNLAEPPEIHLGSWLNYFGKQVTEAAVVAGCSQSYISNIKAGRKTNINYLYLWRIAVWLDLTIDDLFKKAPAVLEPGLSPKARATIRARQVRRA